MAQPDFYSQEGGETVRNPVKLRVFQHFELRYLRYDVLLVAFLLIDYSRKHK